MFRFFFLILFIQSRSLRRADLIFCSSWDVFCTDTAKCLHVGCLGFLSTSWVNLCQGYLGPRAGVLHTPLENLSCCAVMYKIDSGINTHKETNNHAAEFPNREFLSAEPKGKLVLVAAAHKVVWLGTPISLAKGKNCLHLPTKFSL